MPDREAENADFVHRMEMLPLLTVEAKKKDPFVEYNRNVKKNEAKALWKELSVLQKAGLPMSGTEQILLEAKWLINYTLDWKAAGRKLTEAANSMQNRSQDVLEQGNDGAFDSGLCEALYRKLEPTIDALQDGDFDPAAVKPLEFMKVFADPKRLIDRMWHLQITDIAATGFNNRDELGAMQSAFSQLIFKDNLRDLLDAPGGRLGFPISDALACAYLDYVRQSQHPRTGYWGPWYRIDGSLHMVQDLSFTFHQINYRQGNVELWPQIIETTLAIKDMTYPMGWMERDAKRGKFHSNHHNYDVAQIFGYGWSHMTRDQKDRVRVTIKSMLAWCLRDSVTGDSFDDDPSDESYYFGVRFLDRVGYFDEDKRFWTKGALELPTDAPQPFALATRLHDGLARQNNTSNMADHAKKLLDVAKRLNAPDAAKTMADRGSRAKAHG
jgi:hypothetical protein